MDDDCRLFQQETMRSLSLGGPTQHQELIRYLSRHSLGSKINTARLEARLAVELITAEESVYHDLFHTDGSFI